jgi:hypothetical protein
MYFRTQVIDALSAHLRTVRKAQVEEISVSSACQAGYHLAQSRSRTLDGAIGRYLAMRRLRSELEQKFGPVVAVSELQRELYR